MGEAAIEHLTNLNNHTTAIIKDKVKANDLPQILHLTIQRQQNNQSAPGAKKRARKDKAEREEKIAKRQKRCLTSHRTHRKESQSLLYKKIPAKRNIQ